MPSSEARMSARSILFSEVMSLSPSRKHIAVIASSDWDSASETSSAVRIPCVPVSP